MLLGRADAKDSIQKVHDKWDNKNELLTSAVNESISVSGSCACGSLLNLAVACV